MFPGFSALASSTHASCAAPATVSALGAIPPRPHSPTRLLDRHSRHRIACRAALDRSPGRPCGCGGVSTTTERGANGGSFMVGESLVGDGNEVAHIDLLIGSKDGPVGEAFAEALINQHEGHTNLLAVVAPNLPAKPDTLMANKVTMKGATQAVQMFGPAQAAVARAVVDSVREGVIPEDQVDDLCLIVGVFIHWEATDDKKIFDFNYQATKESIARAMKGEPIDAVGARRLRPRRATRSPGDRGVAPTPDPASQPARSGSTAPCGRHGREQRHRRRDRGSVRRRRRHRARHLPQQRGGRARGRRRHRGGRRPRVRRAGRPRHARGLRGARRRGARAARRARRLGQQRRRRRAHRRGGRLGLGAQARPAAGRRPQGHDRVLLRRRRRDARAGRAAARSST